MEEKFKFQVGDVVMVPWLKGEQVLVGCGTPKYPFVLFGDGEYCFTELGFLQVDHDLPVLKFVRRPKKEMTFEMFRDDSIKKLKRDMYSALDK